MKLDVIENECDLNPVLRDWERLNNATPMQSPTWMLAWWQAFRTSGDRLKIVVVRDQSDAVVGLVPWYAHARAGLGTTLRFLGGDRACSDYQTILCQPGSEEPVVRAIAAWLSTGEPVHSPADRSSARRSVISNALGWDLLDLDGVSAADAAMNAFIESMAARGHTTHRREGVSTWKLKIGGGWQAFLETQSKTQRSQSRNLINRFDKSDDLELRLASENPSAGEPFIAALMELHEKRWRLVDREGCFGDERMKQFFASAMRNMIAEGSADIITLERSGRPVAAQAWLIRGSEIFAYQCGRDPDEEPNRIGRIANLTGIRWASERGFQTLDYLRGDEAYKSQLRATPMPCQRVRIVARAGFPQLRHNIWLACRELKSRWEQFRSSHAQRTKASTAEASSDEATAS